MQLVNQLGSPKDRCPKDGFGLGRVRLLYITCVLAASPRPEGLAYLFHTSLDFSNCPSAYNVVPFWVFS